MSGWNWNPFGSSVETHEGQVGDTKVSVSILTGSAAAKAATGTTSAPGSVNIRAATVKPENLDMLMENGKPVRENFVALCQETYSTQTNQDTSLTNFVEEAQAKYIRDHQGKSFKEGNQVVEYKSETDRSDTYSQMTALAGTPDFLPPSKSNLQIKTASTESLANTDYMNTVPKVDYAVNPYDNFYNVAGDKRRTYQQTVGGADLSVFYMAEYPMIEDVIDQIPAEAQRKELVIFELDSALSLSYSILRERFPVRTIGRANPITFTRGSRTIAGHIAFAVFAEDVLTRLRSRIRNKFNEVKERFTGFAENGAGNDQVNGRANSDASNYERMRYFYEAAFQYDKVQLLDSLPQFHLLVMGVNESGMWSKFIIRNVSIVDENQYQGTQQPNIVNKVSWVATDIIPMASFAAKGYTVTDSLNSIDELYCQGALSLSSSHNQLSGSNILDEIRADLAKDQVNDPRELYLMKDTKGNIGL